MNPSSEKEYYDQNLQKFGTTSQGVGWKNDAAQIIRFEQLKKIISSNEFSVNDVGCGVAHFYDYLDQSLPQSKIQYYGYDILREMVEVSARRLEKNTNCRIAQIQQASAIHEADYTVASGIFNLPFLTDKEKWLAHIKETLSVFNNKSRKGFAANFLTSYSDKEFMLEHLYYADPMATFDFCKKNFSTNVALLHDYGEYDFTILVRK